MERCYLGTVKEEESMKAEQKLARGRLSVLELAEALGNVSEACRRRGISRTQFYEYKRRFQKHGIEGLKDLPPVHKSHPMTTPEKVQEKIIALSLSHPAWGCNRVSDQLRLEGISVSAPPYRTSSTRRGSGVDTSDGLGWKRRQPKRRSSFRSSRSLLSKSTTPAFVRDTSSRGGQASFSTRIPSSWGT